MKTLLLSLILCCVMLTQVSANDFNTAITISGHLTKFNGPTGVEISLRPTFYLTVKHPKETFHIELRSNVNFDPDTRSLLISSEDSEIDFGEIPSSFIEQIREQDLMGNHSTSIAFEFTIPFNFVDHRSKDKKSLRWNFGCGITGCGTGGKPIITLATKKQFSLTLESLQGDFICFQKNFESSTSKISSGYCQ